MEIFLSIPRKIVHRGVSLEFHESLESSSMLGCLSPCTLPNDMVFLV